MIPTAARALLLTALSSSPRHAPPRAALPIDGIGGISLERQLGELKFAEVTSVGRDAEDLVAGRAATSVGEQQVSVGLFYGQLTAMDERGTRCLVKRYGADANNALLQRRAAGDAEAARRALEASFAGGGGGVSVAEALAENEYAAHSRVQAKSVLSGRGDVEQSGLVRLLGRQRPRGNAPDADEPAILHAFPWRGEQVRGAAAVEGQARAGLARLRTATRTATRTSETGPTTLRTGTAL